MERGFFVGVFVLAAFGAQAGCGSSGEGGDLVRFRDEPAGDNCAAGGQVILVGRDADGDGELSDDEVASRAYVCDGAGAATVFDFADEPAGEHCAAGGQAVRWGLDVDGDGELDEREVADTRYLCNGQGAASLVSVTEEPPGGEDCPSGGQTIRSGLDDDGDGILQPGEVDATEHVCNGGAGSLVRQEDETEGDCEHGGRVVLSGLDDDGDGYLDDAEVDATSTLCNGGPGPAATPSAFRVTDGAASCPDGGVRVESGHDDNGNGELDDAEVDSGSDVCLGGATAIRVTNAAWGGVCSRGGVRVETGIDGDGDGELSDAEVERTEYVCNLFLVQVSGGNYHSCGVLSDGSAWCWGQNDEGQVGDGTTVDRARMTRVPGLEGVAQVSGGFDHSCAALTDGTVWCWGRNDAGQLGDGSTTRRLAPVRVSGLDGAAAVATGFYHSCAALTDGTARCWGGNDYGQLGDGSRTASATPVVASGLTGVEQIVANDYHTCARRDDGTARCWGQNGFGQLGDGTTNDGLTPVAVAGVTGIASVATGVDHTCAALAAGGGVRCWGHNDNGQLGDGSIVDSTAPVEVTGLTGATAVTAGRYFACALLGDATVRCWGRGSGGQLGDGLAVEQRTPVEPLGLNRVATIAAGAYHVLVTRTDGSAMSWGRNPGGQLGNGTNADAHLPTLVLQDSAP